MEKFLPALLGGALLGLASTLFLLLSGRVTGISGIVNGIVMPRRGDVAWRVWFVGGLIGGALVYRWLNPAWPAPVQSAGIIMLAGAGLLVGFGARMANGCTSGHGVCGLGRLSWRSLAAVLVFTASAMVTVALVRHA